MGNLSTSPVFWNEDPNWCRFCCGWADVVQSDARRPPIFHTAKSENNVKFSWVNHNGRNYGRQIITDNQNKLELTVVFWKDVKGDWSVRLDCKDIGTGKSSQVAIIYYLGISNRDQAVISLLNTKKNQASTGAGVWKGYTPRTQNFHLTFLDDPQSPPGQTNWFGLPKKLNLSDIDDYVPRTLENHRLRNVGAENSDLLLLQKKLHSRWILFIRQQSPTRYLLRLLFQTQRASLPQ